MKAYTLIGADGQSYESTTPGTIGGHRRTRVYGRFDCPAALRAVERGGYVKHRVFFAGEATALAATGPAPEPRMAILRSGEGFRTMAGWKTTRPRS